MSDKAQIPSAERVTPFAEIQKLTLTQTVDRFATSVRASACMFMLAAKLILHIAVTVKAPATVGSVLRKSGIRKTTIDNARQAARVFEELVLPREKGEKGHITEAQFDKLTFAECIVINQSMSGKAKDKQSGKQVAALMKSKPDTWDEELNCLSRYGHSAAKQRQVEKAEAEAAAKAEKAAAKAEKAAAKTDGKTDTTKETPTGDTAGASNVVASGITKGAEKRTAEHAIELIGALDAVFNELTPVEAAKALPALTELTAAVTAMVGTIKPTTAKTKRTAKATRKVVKLPPQVAKPATPKAA